MVKKRKTLIVAISVVLVLALGMSVAVFFAGRGGIIQTFFPIDVSDRMEAKSFSASNGIELPYRIAIADTAVPDEGLPVVLFLHGAGPSGSDNYAQVRRNTVFQTLLNDKNREKYPCIAVAPQCPPEFWWGKDEEGEAPVAEAVMELLESIIGEHSADPARVYITCLSMGGSGTWSMLELYPDFFAAAAPCCGGGNASAATSFSHVPIWVFHGRRDQYVDVEDSRQMVKALEDAGSTIVKYTEYPWENHASWELAYRETELFPWMFSQKRT